MKKNSLIVTLCLLVFFGGLLSSNMRVSAAGESAAGGQVSTTSKITFHGEVKKPTPKPTPDPPVKPKPNPILPQTGETQSGLGLLGVGVLGLLLGILVIKRRQEAKA